MDDVYLSNLHDVGIAYVWSNSSAANCLPLHREPILLLHDVHLAPYHLFCLFLRIVSFFVFPFYLSFWNIEFQYICDYKLQLPACRAWQLWRHLKCYPSFDVLVPLNAAGGSLEVFLFNFTSFKMVFFFAVKSLQRWLVVRNEALLIVFLHCWWMCCDGCFLDHYH